MALQQRALLLLNREDAPDALETWLDIKGAPWFHPAQGHEFPLTAPQTLRTLSVILTGRQSHPLWGTNGNRLSTISIACSGSLYTAEHHNFAAPVVASCSRALVLLAVIIVHTSLVAARASAVAACAVSALAGIGAAPALAVVTLTTPPVLAPAAPGVKRLRNEALGPPEQVEAHKHQHIVLTWGPGCWTMLWPPSAAGTTRVSALSAEQPRRAADGQDGAQNGTPNHHQVDDGDGNKPSAPLQLWVRSHRDLTTTRSLPRLLRRSVADRGLLSNSLKPPSSRRTGNLQCQRKGAGVAPARQPWCLSLLSTKRRGLGDLYSNGYRCIREFSSDGTLASVEEQRLVNLKAKAAKGRTAKKKTAEAADDGDGDGDTGDQPFLDWDFNLPDSTNFLHNPSIRDRVGMSDVESEPKSEPELPSGDEESAGEELLVACPRQSP
ncbi:hypothetical protein DL766_005723 [Monosporascus sp. MC13-8B]|nr:hypothetical protein DL766_005723 [Monosporascus sp. MC13-8B]